VSDIYQIFSQRKGVVFSEENVQETPLIEVKAYLPLLESFGFTAHLKTKSLFVLRQFFATILSILYVFVFFGGENFIFMKDVCRFFCSIKNNCEKIYFSNKNSFLNVS